MSRSPVWSAQAETSFRKRAGRLLIFCLPLLMVMHHLGGLGHGLGEGCRVGVWGPRDNRRRCAPAHPLTLAERECIVVEKVTRDVFAGLERLNVAGFLL